MTIDELAVELRDAIQPEEGGPVLLSGIARDWPKILARLVRRKELEARIEEQDQYGGDESLRYNRLNLLTAELASLEEPAHR
jgi:hypothetical protein